MKLFHGRRALSAIAVASMLALASPAHSHEQAKWDGNDVTSPIDIKWAGIGHTKRVYYGAIATVNSVRSAMLGGKGDVYMDFDSKGDRKADYYVWINYRNGLKARVYRYTTNSAVYVGRGRAWRHSSTTFNFRFPRKLVRRSGDYIRWAANTRYFNRVNSYGDRLFSWDWSPDRGMRTHKF